MGFEQTKLWRLMIIMVVLWRFLEEEGVKGLAEVPCYFIFGDSLADNGNNNNLPTLAKVDYSPYGIDFPYGPTGRFTNGRTSVDFLAEKLGFYRFIPPYATSSIVDIFFGVNYASGSAGILNETGKQLGERVPFDMQLENHRSTVLRLGKILGIKKLVDWYLGKCLYTVGLGNNDYINNYFVPDYYNSSQEYTLSSFTQLLIEKYTYQIKRLYGYGARKIAIFGLGSLGCTPSAISKHGRNGSCVEIMEEASILFNSLLISVVDQLNRNYTDATFTYINFYSIAAAASGLGFTNATSGCCPISSDGQCIPDQVPCKDRTAYVFWDAFHPTQILNEHIAQRSYVALEPSDAYPVDIRTLVLCQQLQVSSLIAVHQPNYV